LFFFYDLKGKKRTQNIAFARQLAMYIGREMTDYSTTELGQDFGGRDHTTVMHSIEKIKGKLLTDPTLDSTIESLKRSIKEFGAKH
jgi:chromosomal replication initiator protein